MKISKEVKTGVLVLLGIALFVFGFNYLKGQSLFDSSSTYHTEFNFNDLTLSSPVTVKGNVVGKIKDIVYDYKTEKTKVSFTVSDELEFSKTTKVKLYEVGPMSGSGLAILVNREGALATSGDVLESVVEAGLVKSLSKNFSGLSKDLDATLRTSDTLLTNLNNLVVDDSKDGLKSTIKELNNTLRSFKATSNSVNNVIAKNDKNITIILDKFKTMSGELAVLSKQLKDANVGTTVTTLNQTLGKFNKILTNLENNKGSMGKLLNDDKLYDNLTGASKELEALLRDVKLHPKRYFRILSKKEIPYEKE